MPNQTKIVKKDGSGDYTDLDACVKAADVSGGFWKCVVSDAGVYGPVLINQSVGVPTESRNIIVTVSDDFRHGGFIESGLPVIESMQVAFKNNSVVDGLIFSNQNESANNFCMKVNNCDDTIYTNCIANGNNKAENGVFVRLLGAQDAYFDHCVIYNAKTYGVQNSIEVQDSVSSRVFMDYCTIVNNSKGFHSRATQTGTAIRLEIKNTVSINDSNDFGEDTSVGGAPGEFNVVYDSQSTNNAAGDGSLSSRMATNAIQSLVLGKTAIFRSEEKGSESYLLDGDSDVNKLVYAGITKTEKKNNQDWTNDIAGLPRASTPSIGASEYYLSCDDPCESNQEGMRLAWMRALKAKKQRETRGKKRANQRRRQTIEEHKMQEEAFKKSMQDEDRKQKLLDEQEKRRLVTSFSRGDKRYYE